VAYETIELVVDAGVAKLTLNRPERLNSFTVEMHGEIAAALDAVERDAAVRTLLLTGAGRGFCAGQDLSDPSVTASDGPVDLGVAVETYYNPLIRRLVALPCPVICAVNGVAAGAGANLALAADIVIAARSARFIQSFAAIGLIPDTGGTWVLPRLVGQARALGLALTGQPLTAEQAVEWGMIWQVVDDDKLAETSQALAARFAGGATMGLAATRKMIRESWQHGLDEELDRQRDAMRRLGLTEDYREGVAAFTEKRKPVFKAR
jgi:2-(1,2-epoxy-1,2-dihydrophenyl)acetyl-CoA isomerase